MKRQLTAEETLAVIGRAFHECRAFWLSVEDREHSLDELALRDIEVMTTDPNVPTGGVLLDLDARDNFVERMRLSI